MKLRTTLTLLSLTVALGLPQSGCVTGGDNPSPSEMARLDSDATAALHSLYAGSSAAKTLAHKAKGILIFPDVLKGGFMVGGQTGNGVLRQSGRTVGYYNTIAASYGFQVGLQRFGYVLFLMNDRAMAYLHNTGGWEVGVGPSIVVLDSGTAKTLTTTTLRSDVYAFVFNQEGLMDGAGLQGSKITEIQP